MFNSLFSSIFEMSIAASWLILAIIVLRVLFKKLPKSMTYLLWSVIAFRLVVPFSVDTLFSLFPDTNRVLASLQEFTFVKDFVYSDASVEMVENGIYAKDLIGQACIYLWIIGIFLLLGYSLYSYMKLKEKVEIFWCDEMGIYHCDYIETPFILGVIHPTIYLPSNLDEEAKESVVAHERVHIQRKDYIWKMLAYVVLLIHWLNPLVWCAFILFEKDLEFACDEQVIMDMKTSKKREYCQVLLRLSTRHFNILTCPLAFGEIAVKERVKNIFHYKKLSLGQIGIFMMAFSMVFLVGMSAPLDKNDIIVIKDRDKTHAYSIYAIDFKYDILHVNFSDDMYQLGAYWWFGDPYNSYNNSGKIPVDVSDLTIVSEDGDVGVVERSRMSHCVNILKKENDAFTYILYDSYYHTIEYTMKNVVEIEINYMK